MNLLSLINSKVIDIIKNSLRYFLYDLLLINVHLDFIYLHPQDHQNFLGWKGVMSGKTVKGSELADLALLIF